VRVPAATITPHLDVILPAFVAILQRRDGIDIKPWQRQAHRALLGNICITIGRLGSVCTERMGKDLPTFITPWCVVMRTQRMDPEKLKALLGLCQMLQVNPMAGAQCFSFLAGMIAYVPPLPQIQPQFLQILNSYKAQFGAGWAEVYNGLTPDVKRKLGEMYQLTQ